MAIGAGTVPEGPGQNNWGKRNDNSQLGEGKDQTGQKESIEIESNFENLKVGFLLLILFSSDFLQGKI